MSLLIKRITLAALMAALVGGTFALPAGSSASPVAHASKCKKAKKGKRKKKKKCKRGQAGATLPGQATHPNTTPPTQTPTPTVSDIAVTSNPVLGGDSTTGQVTISGPAPSGGQPVGLQSDTGRATVPGSVVVPAGQTTATFPVGTSAGPSVTAILTGAIGTSSDQVQLKVVSDPSVASVSLEHKCFTPGTYAANRVTLDVPAPADTSVSLASDDASAFSVAPGSTTVPAGSKTAFFGALAGSPVSPVTVTVTATLGSSFATASALVSATNPAPAVSGVSLQPSSVIVGGVSDGTVTLDCEASSDVVVNLSSDQPSIANPSQPTVTVPAGQLSAPFQVETSAAGTAHISATTGTGGTQQATLAVNSLGT